MFINGLEKYGKRWSKIAALVKTRTLTQIRTHAQKYYLKLSKEKHNNMTSSEGDGDKESDISQEQQVRYGQVVQLLEEEDDDDSEETEESEENEELNAAQSLIDLGSVYKKSDQSTPTMIQHQDGAGSMNKVRHYWLYDIIINHMSTLFYLLSDNHYEIYHECMHV